MSSARPAQAVCGARSSVPLRTRQARTSATAQSQPPQQRAVSQRISTGGRPAALRPGAPVLLSKSGLLAHRRGALVVARAGDGDDEPLTATQEIPIFPLGLCAHPMGEVPLNIFEARYRVLFNTLLAGAEGLETDLIDDSSPFKGTRSFGMSLVDGREMASVGTMLHIERHERMPNGTMVILTRGGRRFRVVRVVKQQPVLICEVVWVDDALVDEMGEDDEFTLPELAEEVSTLYRTTVQLSNKVNAGKGEPVVEEVPGEGLSPQEASFWYMRVFSAFPGKQQQLLELTSTRERLKAVQDVLRETSRYLGATSALKSALQEITNKPSEDTPPQ